MLVRLQLKKEYEYASMDPRKPNKNKIGFVLTDCQLPIGKRVLFEDLNPESIAGCLNTSHYKYFAGKEFESVTPPYSTISVELLEV